MEGMLILSVPVLCQISEEGVYVLSFQATIPDSRKQTLHFAFCYPHSYTDCQKLLSKLDEQYSTVRGDCPKEDRIYYHRYVFVVKGWKC